MQCVHVCACVCMSVSTCACVHLCMCVCSRVRSWADVCVNITIRSGAGRVLLLHNDRMCHPMVPIPYDGIAKKYPSPFPFPGNKIKTRMF